VYGLLWLALRELRQAGLRSGLAALAVALAILTMSILGRQAETRQSAILRGYEEDGATTFVAELVAITENEIGELVEAVRDLPGVAAAEAPYRGSDLGIIADTSFLVFENGKQQEYLGATTAVIGVTDKFDPGRDYYEAIGSSTTDQRRAPLGIPLLVTNGIARGPAPGEVLVPAVVAEYVGERLDARATLELILADSHGPPIVRRYEGLRVIGTFDAVGPDEGRFAPFWRFAARGRDVLTVRRPDRGDEKKTTLPVVVNVSVLRDFMMGVQEELTAQGRAPVPEQNRSLLVIRADAVAGVTSAQQAVQQLLKHRSLADDCQTTGTRSFCLRLPERNNFQTALHEQTTFVTGVKFFANLLLLLVATGSAGLQLQTIIMRWHEHAVLEALGFTPLWLLGYSCLRVLLIFTIGLAIAGVVSLSLPSMLSGSLASFATASGLLTAASLSVTVPVLFWALRAPPGERLRELR
jgi:hypothetical protein